MATGGKRKLAEVTPTAYRGWSSFCRVYGSNPTALAEAIGLYLDDIDVPAKQLPKWLRELVQQATEIEDTRKRRPQGQPDAAVDVSRSTSRARRNR